MLTHRNIYDLLVTERAPSTYAHGGTMSTSRYYRVIFGSIEHTFYCRDPERALRRVHRWIRIYWRSAALGISLRYPGSMAAATNEGWHKPPRWKLYSSSIDDSGVIQLDGRLDAEGELEAVPLPEGTFY